jgi:glycosyltransferase involved in cell wall biosynthesis
MIVKILSIVTLVSPTGEYGGPVRVALNQAQALIDRGHEVTIAGAHRGYDGVAPTDLHGIPAALFPARTVLPGAGFAGLTSPALNRWLRTAVRGFDMVHVHAARDLVTLPAAHCAYRAAVPFVLQPHGMIDPSSNPLARPLDSALTRPLLRSAKRVFYLTPEEHEALVAVGGSALALQELVNGVPIPTESRAAESKTEEVLYLARMAPRKRPLMFVEMARRLAHDHPETRFTLIGPDEGEGKELRRAIAGEKSARVSWEGALAPEATTERMASASIYVLPSINEPFPMSVLEAMALGLPVVITESCGLAPLVRRTGCGLVTDETQAGLDDAVRSLLDDAVLARAMGEKGSRVAREELSMTAVARILEEAYSG